MRYQILYLMAINVFSGTTVIDATLKECVAFLIRRLFSPGETLYIVTDDLNDLDDYQHLQVLSEIQNPRLVIVSHKTINTTLKNFNSFVIFTGEYANLSITLERIKESGIWSESESPRGKFLVVTSATQHLEDIFELLWSFDIINIVLLQTIQDGLYLYKVNPFTEGSKCATKARLDLKQTCSANTTVSFDKTIKSLRGCPVKLLTHAPLSRDPYITGGAGVYVNLMYMFGEALKTNVSALITTNARDAIRESDGDLRILLEVARGDKLYEEYDLSNIVYQDEIVWVVPTPARIPTVELILYIFKASVWGTMIAAFFVITLIIWATANYTAEPLAFKKISNNVLAVLSYTFNTTTNFAPVTNTLRCIWIFYLFYCLLINTAFQGKLISTLTNPKYGPPMKDLDDLANSDVTVIVQAVIEEYTFGPEFGDTWTKLQKKFVIQNVMNLAETLNKIAHFRNCGAPLTRGDVNIVHADLRPMVTVVDQNKGFLDAQAIVGMRRGHYIMNTFNTISMRLTESGFHKKILTDAVRPKFTDNEDPEIVLSINHLVGIFIWWICGLSAALGVFIIELFVFYCF